MRLIDADALKEKCPSNLGAPLWLIDEMPTIEPCRYWDNESNFCGLYRPAAIKHGRWIKCGDIYSDGDYECSECHKREWDETDYCPNCGARMDEVKKCTTKIADEIAKKIIEEARKACANCQEFVCDECEYRWWRKDEVEE